MSRIIENLFEAAIAPAGFSLSKRISDGAYCDAGTVAALVGFQKGLEVATQHAEDQIAAAIAGAEKRLATAQREHEWDKARAQRDTFKAAFACMTNTAIGGEHFEARLDAARMRIAKPLLDGKADPKESVQEIAPRSASKRLTA